MQTFSAKQVAEALSYDQLIDALDEAFRTGAVVPDRVHHNMEIDNGHNATLLLMPAWQTGGSLGVKIATVYPDNARLNLSAVHASYFLMDAATGAPRAVLDGSELTLRRTACASALASRYLSREGASDLLMVGTGKLAPHLVAAHTAVRKLDRIVVWGRREEAARELADALIHVDAKVEVSANLEKAAQQADIISCATLANEPLICGAWLSGGTHLDLVGSFTEDMREADDDAVRRARVFVDTYNGALSEAGELVQAIRRGVISRSDIVADLAELAGGKVSGRTSDADITLFKSVGTALEDLAAAELVVGRGQVPQSR